MSEAGKRLEHLLGVLEGEVDILQVEKRIRGRVKRQMEKSQREYYLNEQSRRSRRNWARRRERRPGRDGKEDQGRADVQGSRGQGGGRDEEASDDVADVRRGDRRAQLHRYAARLAVAQEEQDQQGPRERGEGLDAITTAWKR